MNRRDFLILVSAATASSLLSSDAWAVEDSSFDIIDAGPLGSFDADKVYDQLRDQGAFVIRRGDEVFALSSICTHKGCKVRAQDDQSFLCKCHKSRFDPMGKVLNGPAKKDLPRIAVKLSDQKHVLLKVPKRTENS